MPFSPVTGPRLLAAPGALRPAIVKALAETLVAVTDKIGVSSLHVTFANADEWAALGALGLQQRRGIQVRKGRGGVLVGVLSVVAYVCALCLETPTGTSHPAHPHPSRH